MLEHLYVKNVAIIDELEVDFGGGLNILSGETGAGKSIIIDSINFVLGERPSKDFIRTGQASAEVTALLSVNNKDTKDKLKQTGVFLDDDEGESSNITEILLNRTLTASGRSICRINGKAVTAGMLKDVSELLIDIHGQHEHQSLLNSSRHIELLDGFCGDELRQIKGLLAASVVKYKETLASIRNISGENMDDREEKIDIYTFQINEIESAELQTDEEELLLEQRKIMSSFEKITTAAGEVLTVMKGGSKSGSVTDKLWDVYANVQNIVSIDKNAEGLLDAIAGICAQADDFAGEFIRYYDMIEHDPNELNKLEERLDVIYKLKKKYGKTILDILEHLDKTKAKLDFLLNSEKELIKLNDDKIQLGKEAMKYCADMSAIRKATAERLEQQISEALADLGMKNAQFTIQIGKRDGFGINGYDKVEFLISANIGETAKPLSKIASGGEMSRVMLALKAVLAGADSIETFIFDEIDTGVSGRTAQQVAEKLALIAIKHQILCITHLPQIAAMGNNNYLIEKEVISEENRTTTRMYALDKAQVTKELARLIGGAEITEATLRAAEEMKEQAEQLTEVFKRSFDLS